MTVISTIITRYYTAHASDSFLTKSHPGGKQEVIEKKKSKLVRVPAYRGVMGYWGLARYNGWNTFDWLQERSNRANGSACAAAFADDLAAATVAEFRRKCARPLDMGLGIRFTAYEYIEGYWIPELFVLSNWTDASYAAVQPHGFRVTRETYATLKGLPDRTPDHGQPACRLEVHRGLHDEARMFCFNNGDPTPFNPIANSILASFAELSRRGKVKKPSSVLTHLSIARNPVDIVSKLYRELTPRDTRLVGGKPHDLAVNSGGVYESRTGD
jgi:hypothetical protein